jgi:hypothetical protein
MDTTSIHKLYSARKVQQSYEEKLLEGDPSTPKIEAAGSSETFETLCQSAPRRPHRQ